MTLASLASRTAAPKRTPTRPLKAAQHRTIWQNSRQTRGHPCSNSSSNNDGNIGWIRSERKLRRRTTHPNTDAKPSSRLSEDADPWRQHWGPGWGMFNSGFGSREWIEKERMRAEQRMDRVKKIIEADPYAALFGRRLERGFGHGPFGLWGKHQSGENSLGELWRELFGVGKGAAGTGGDKIDGSAGTAGSVKTASTTGHVKSTKDRSPSMGDEVLSKGPLSNDAPPEKPWSYTGFREDHEFDPISGRMAPKSPADSQTENLDFDPITGRMIPKGQSSAGDVSYKGTSESEPLGYLSPVKRTGSEVITGTNFNDVQNGQEPEHKDSIASKIAMDEPSDSTFKSHSSTLKDTSAKDETPQPQIFHGTPDKAPTKLKVQDSAQQSEPILVPENQELDSLRANDIRASYESKMTNASSEVKNEPAQAFKDEVMSSADSSNVVGEKSLRKSLDQDALTSVDEKITELEKGTATLKTQLQDVKAMEATTSDVLDGQTTYCVLAYDPSTQQVSRAETASSLSSSDEILHPTQVLPRLNNPAKFVNHFEKMQKDGYEIVSGGGDILIFRKFADVDASRANEAPAEDNTYKASEADVLSDPQVLEYMATSSPELSSEPPESKAAPRKEASGIRKALRRMVFAGTVTAGTCYAIGVVTEYFRTGGQDGRGIDGFTEFESERRRGD